MGRPATTHQSVLSRSHPASGQHGLKGRSYWGRRVAITWADVASVKNTSVEGIPALLIGSSTSKAELFAYTLGVSIPDIYTGLYRYAGPQHMLTYTFRPSAA